jgi:hypothetical protein
LKWKREKGEREREGGKPDVNAWLETQEQQNPDDYTKRAITTWRKKIKKAPEERQDRERRREEREEREGGMSTVKVKR